ncbi:hypothetical protein [Actinoplanes sp. NPDC051494]|uniref:hypothetical protein n=1 Tax=Actinoplanes sp. NPDC051494 TaxID=3363907 RepID=UPI00378F317A
MDDTDVPARIVVARDALARAVVARLAPDEITAFDMLAADWSPAPRRARDTPLGSGLEGFAETLTPYALAAAGWAVAALGDGVRAELERRGESTTRGLFDRWRRRRKSPELVVTEPFTPAQLNAVRAVIAARTAALADAPAAVELLADAVVGELALLNTRPAPGSDEGDA